MVGGGATCVAWGGGGAGGWGVGGGGGGGGGGRLGPDGAGPLASQEPRLSLAVEEARRRFPRHRGGVGARLICI